MAAIDQTIARYYLTLGKMMRVSAEYKASEYVDRAPKELKNQILRDKIIYIALSILTVGLWALGGLIMDQLKIKLINRAFLPSTFMKLGWEHILNSQSDRIKIETLDHVHLDAQQVTLDTDSKKWMVYFCPNGASYEQVAREVIHQVQGLGINVLFFNYRGVEHSQGRVTKGFQLTLDGSAVLEYLKQKKGIKEQDILLHGHSMGGGVAATLLDYYPNVACINNRSYSSTGNVVAAHVRQATNRVFAGIAKGLNWCIGYNIDALGPWMRAVKGKHLLIYHPEDFVIPYHGGSLYRSVKQKIKIRNAGAAQAKKPSSALKHPKESGLAPACKPRHIRLNFAIPENSLYTPIQRGLYYHCQDIDPKSKEGKELTAYMREFAKA